MSFASLISITPLMAAGVFAIGTGLMWARTAPLEIDRNTARTFLLAWTALLTVHFWLAGPYSYGVMTFDLGNTVARTLYLVNHFKGGQFSQAFGGGVDVSLVSSGSGATLHINELMLAALPIWLAYAVHKILVVLFGAFGTYLLARRVGGAERLLATILAAFGSVASIKLTGWSFTHGLGHALVPLVTYVIVFRAGTPWYWPSVIAVGALWAVSGSPTHSGMGLAAALLLTWLFMGHGQRLKIALATAVIGLLILANWHDGLWAKQLLGGLTYRGTNNPHLFDAPLTAALRALRSVETPQWTLITFGLIGVATMFIGRDERRYRFLGLWAGAILIGPLMIALPWHLIGLKLLNGLSWWNTYIAGNAIHPLILAAAFSRTAHLPAIPSFMSSRRLMAGVTAIALSAQAGFLLAERSVSMVLGGGIANMTTAIEFLITARDGLDPGVRTVSVPVRLEANFAAAAGLKTLDGLFNPFLARKDRFWDEAVMHGHATPWLMLPTDRAHAMADIDGPVPAADLYDLDALRVANVGYIISRVPLSGDGIRQVYGPDNPPNLTREEGGLTAKLRQKLAKAFTPPPVLIYRLSAPVPYVFAAQTVATGDPAAADFVDTAQALAMKRSALLEENPAASVSAHSTLEVKGWASEGSVVSIDIDAPDGGLLMVNMPHMPHWRAQVDGMDVPVLPANLIHMAVPIPAGARHTVLRYHRPTVFEAISARLK